MALPATTVWEIRTGGVDTNGGGFVTGATGTDFSQQNAAQFSGTDLASANGNAASPQVTSATHNFVATDVGNLINVSAGTNWTAGFYQIVSVAANAATLDRAVGTVAALTAGTWAEGGALLTPQKSFGSAVNGNKVWIQSGTYVTTVNIGFNVGVGPVTVEGYGSVRGDRGTKPLLTTATNAIDGFVLGNQNNTLINLEFSSTAGTPGDGIFFYNDPGGPLYVSQCKIHGFRDGIRGGSNTIINVFGTEIGPVTTSGVSHVTGGGQCTGTIDSCYIHDCGSRGIDNIDFLRVFNTIISTCVNAGITLGTLGAVSILVDHCSIDNCNTGGADFGIVTLSVSTFNVSNTIMYKTKLSATPGLAAQLVLSPKGVNMGRNNAYGAVSSNTDSNLVDTFGTVTLTADPFVNAATGNFALNGTAGAGAACTAAAWPGIFPGGLTTSNSNIGAVENSGATSTAAPFAFVH